MPVCLTIVSGTETLCLVMLSIDNHNSFWHSEQGSSAEKSSPGFTTEAKDDIIIAGTHAAMRRDAMHHKVLLIDSTIGKESRTCNGQ